MINFFMTLLLTYKPVHMVYEPSTCGATERFLKERISLTVKNGEVRTGSIKWTVQDKVDGYYLATYKAAPDAYMSMSIMFDEHDGYMTIQGIDAKRKPCRDTVYFKRSK
jgi:hypothetical protein